MHHGSTDITKGVVHPEGEGGIEVDNLADEFSVSLGPVVDCFKDVCGNWRVGLECRQMLEHPLIRVIAVFDERLGGTYIVTGD